MNAKLANFGLVLAIVLISIAGIESQIFNNDTDINYGTAVTPKECIATQILETGGCAIGCVFTPLTDHNVSNVIWTYFTTDPNNHYTYDMTDKSITCDYNKATPTKAVTTTLLLTTYYAGYYRCSFVTDNDTDSINSRSNVYTFRFNWNSTDSDADLGANCVDTTNCLALNSNCATTCGCATNNVAFDNKLDTPACMPKEAENGTCQSNNQCDNTGKYSIYCLNQTCTCNGTHTQIDSTGENVCLASVKLGGSCWTNEQCTLADDNSECLGQSDSVTWGTCGCKPDYENIVGVCVSNAITIPTRPTTATPTSKPITSPSSEQVKVHVKIEVEAKAEVKVEVEVEVESNALRNTESATTIIQLKQLGL